MCGFIDEINDIGNFSSPSFGRIFPLPLSGGSFLLKMSSHSCTDKMTFARNMNLFSDTYAYSREKIGEILICVIIE